MNEGFKEIEKELINYYILKKKIDILEYKLKEIEEDLKKVNDRKIELKENSEHEKDFDDMLSGLLKIKWGEENKLMELKLKTTYLDMLLKLLDDDEKTILEYRYKFNKTMEYIAEITFIGCKSTIYRKKNEALLKILEVYRGF